MVLNKEGDDITSFDGTFLLHISRIKVNNVSLVWHNLKLTTPSVVWTIFGCLSWHGDRPIRRIQSFPKNIERDYSVSLGNNCDSFSSKGNGHIKHRLILRLMYVLVRKSPSPKYNLLSVGSDVAAHVYSKRVFFWSTRVFRIKNIFRSIR